jgi:hypothetical protein
VIRRISFISLIVVAAIVAWPTATRAASIGAVRRAVDRVELAAVDNSPGACSVMGPNVRRDYIQGADVTSGARTAPKSCAAAVRDDHAGYLRDHELAAERAAQQAVVRAFAAGPVTFRKAGHQAIVVAHLKTRRFLGSVPTTITARLARSATTWTVLTVSESPSGAVSPPPPIP